MIKALKFAVLAVGVVINAVKTEYPEPPPILASPTTGSVPLAFRSYLTCWQSGMEPTSPVVWAKLVPPLRIVMEIRTMLTSTDLIWWEQPRRGDSLMVP